MRGRTAFCLLAAVAAWSCARGVPPPVDPDTRSDTCRSCRMAISDPHTAAQIVAPLEEPIFFDDVGCLRDYLQTSGPMAGGAVAYVADHRTGEWVPAGFAVYTKVPALDTPMGSHLIAHVSNASRDADPAARGGDGLTVSEVFGADRPLVGHGR